MRRSYNFLAGSLKNGGIEIHVLNGKTSKIATGFYSGELRFFASPLRLLWALGQNTASPSLFFVCDEKLIHLQVSPTPTEGERGEAFPIQWAMTQGNKGIAH